MLIFQNRKSTPTQKR